MTKEDRKWPGYLLGGHVRTSTVVLLVAFCLVWWLYQEYKPAPQPVQTPATDVVPPGFVPDPAYTWVPRTNVEEPRRTTTTTTPTTTEATSPTSTDTTTTGTSATGSSTTSPTTTAPPAPAPGTGPSSPTPAVPGPGPSPSPSR
jgi:hypothetical protein